MPVLILELKSSVCERGPGYWKMNDMVVNSDLFYNVFTTLLEKWKEEANSFKSKTS